MDPNSDLVDILISMQRHCEARISARGDRIPYQCLVADFLCILKLPILWLSRVKHSTKVSIDLLIFVVRMSFEHQHFLIFIVFILCIGFLIYDKQHIQDY